MRILSNGYGLAFNSQSGMGVLANPENTVRLMAMSQSDLNSFIDKAISQDGLIYLSIKQISQLSQKTNKITLLGSPRKRRQYVS